MKKLFVSAVIVVMSVVGLVAKDVDYTGCTKDKKVVLVTIKLADNTKPAVMELIQKHFREVAATRTVEQLQSREGYLAFWKAISGTTEENNAIEGFPKGAPQPVGVCN